MAVVEMKQLLESGVHFGHATRRWNPKMGKYIFTARNGIYIIDLQKTAKAIEVAYQALFQIVKDGGKVLFVGTKKQAQEAVKEEANRCGQYYVDQRWLGGTMTNFKTISRRIKRLQTLYKMEKDGTFDVLPKKEVLGLVHEREKLEKFLGGIKNMKKIPEALFIIDPRKERNAILEARKLNIPVFGIVDTNCDPDDVDYVIPANDDAIRAVKLVTWVMGNAIIEAQGGVIEKFPEDLTEEAAPKGPRKDFDGKRDYKDRPRRDYKNDGRNQNRTEAPRAEAKAEVKAEVKAEAKVEVKEAPKAEVKAEVKETVNYSTMKVAELKEIAKAKNIENYEAMKKAELVEALSK